VIGTSLGNLWYGFGVALQPSNLMWSFFGVFIGNLVGVLPGMGVLTTISILLPLTYALSPIAAVLLLAGIFYGAQYGAAVCSILLNLPCHPSHVVTCIDAYPLTRQGKGGMALGITMMSSFVGASVGIIIMVLFSSVVVALALQFGPAEYFSLLLFGLLAGSTMSKGDPIKGVAMMVFGMLLGVVGTDVTSGVFRFTFGILDLSDGIELVALALGLFGIGEFLKSVNKMVSIQGNSPGMHVRAREMLPTLADIRVAAWPTVRGTLIGAIFGFLPGTGPTPASFISYAAEKKLSKYPERFGHGAIEGFASSEASTHSCVQVDFIPTLTLGIPGEAVMALLLSALLIKGIQPGPQFISAHPSIFWGLVASFWIGNVMLIILNIPLIGLWVRLLSLPYRYIYPSALFFICIGVWSTRSSLVLVAETLIFGIVGYVFAALEFEIAPLLLGFVLEPLVEENFRRAMIFSRGDLATFVERPISAAFLCMTVLLLAVQSIGLARLARKKISANASATLAE